MLNGLEITVNCKDKLCGKVKVKIEAVPGKWIGRCPNPHCRKVILEAKRTTTDVVDISKAVHN